MKKCAITNILRHKYLSIACIRSLKVRLEYAWMKFDCNKLRLDAFNTILSHFPACFLVIQTVFAATLVNMATAGTTAPSLAASRNLFAADIFQTLARTRSQENLVFSPASIQSCLALAFLGAEGETAQQLRRGLRLPAVLDKASIAADYAGFLQKNFHKDVDEAEDEPKLRMVNRLYFNESLKLSPKFNELAKASFESEAVPTKFADSSNAADTINTWVENETEGKITDLLQPDAVNAETSAILVNAIYFKVKWLNPFSPFATSNDEFRMSDGQVSMVPMMYGDERVKYGEFADLDAKAIELPYQIADLSMLLILPNKVGGLAALEQELANTDLNLIVQRMRTTSVDIFLPKFCIEFEVDLKQPLQKVSGESLIYLIIHI